MQQKKITKNSLIILIFNIMDIHKDYSFLSDTDCNDTEKMSDWDRLEFELEKQLQIEQSDLEILNENKKNIGNPDSLGKVVGDEIWNQFLNQTAGFVGEENVAIYRVKSDNQQYYTVDSSEKNEYKQGSKVSKEAGNYHGVNSKEVQDTFGVDSQSAQNAINDCNYQEFTKYGGGTIGEATGTGKVAFLFLLRKLGRKIIAGLVSWLKEGKMNLSSFLQSVEKSIREFIDALKKDSSEAIKAGLTSLFSAILGPIVGTVKKIWSLLKTGWKSLKEAFNYLKSSATKNQPFAVTALEVSKILIGGLAAGGGLVLGEAIEKGILSAAPAVGAFSIPLFGTVANLLGMFLGALISGVVGAIALNFIDKVLAKKRKDMNTNATIQQNNKILSTHHQLLDVLTAKKEDIKKNVAGSIKNRHMEASDVFNNCVSQIDNNICDIENILNGTHIVSDSKIKQDLDDILNQINKM